jgi:hypothetical protein
MPQYIDKTSALAWLDSQDTAHMTGCKAQFLTLFCEYLAVHGTQDVSVQHLESVASFIDNATHIIVVTVDKTKQRQETKSYEVYILDQALEDIRATTLFAALYRSDKNGCVKVNYRCELDQAFRATIPLVRITHL